MKLRFRILRAFLALFALLLLICVGLVGWRFLSIRSGQQLYDNRIKELAAKGTAVDEAGVNRLHSERSSPEFADQWRAIFADFAKPEFQEASAQLPYLGNEGFADTGVPPRGEPWEAEADARKFLVDYMQLRDRVRKLAVKSQAVYFPLVRESDGGSINEAHLSIRTATKLLVLDCFMALRANAHAVAYEDLRALVGLSHFLQGEPNSIAFLIDQAAMGAALNVIQTGIEQHSFNESLLKQVLALLESNKIPSDHFWLAVEGQRGIAQTVLSELAQKQGAVRLLLGSPQARINALDMYQGLQQLTFDDLDKCIADMDQIENISNRYLSSVRFPTSADHYAPLEVSSTLAVAKAVVRQQSHLRLAKLAIAIELYRLKTNRLPESLNDVAEIGVDLEQNKPVGGKPFGYRLSDDKTSAEIWGFDLLSRNKQTPDTPPEVDEMLDPEPWWLWKINLNTQSRSTAESEATRQAAD